jgi:hypothetical protein
MQSPYTYDSATYINAYFIIECVRWYTSAQLSLAGSKLWKSYTTRVNVAP